MKNFIFYSFLVSLVLSITACDQSSQHSESISGDSDNNDTVVISGVASKGPISAAQIEIFAFDQDDGSESGVSIATTTTDSNGRWSVSIPSASHTEGLLIKSSGGEYLDESDPESDITKKRTITFGTTDSISGVLFPGFSTSSVTMMTSALVEKSRIEANGSDFLNVLNNNRNIATSALGFDPFTVTAANPLSPPAGSSQDSIEYAMYLGGMATALNSAAILLSLPEPNYEIVEAFVFDMADGRLNGVNQNGPVTVMVNGSSVVFPTDIDLNQSIRRFRNNNYSAYSVTSVTETVTVDEDVLELSGTNANPVAIDDAVATTENSAVIVSSLLANDSDPDGDSLVILSFTQPANGQVANNNNGSLTYTPNSGYNGADSFSYTISDFKGGTATALVSVSISEDVTVEPPVDDNIIPVANAGPDQSANELSVISLSGSATDSDGTIAGYQWSQVSGTPVTIGSSGSASANFTSPEVLIGNIEVLVFQLAVTDNDGGVGLDFVTMIVSSVTIPPTANAGVDQTLEELQTVNLDGSASSDDRNIVSYSWNQISGSPTVSITGSNNANASFAGPDVPNNATLVFELTVTDDEGGTDTDTVSINLTSLNAGPVLTNDSGYNASEETPLLINDLLANDNDPESDSFTINTVTQPANGTVVIEAGNASVTYTPNLNFNGSDSFTYSAVDEFGAFSLSSAIVDISVSGLNDDPIANNDSASTTQGFPVTIIDLLDNDTDPEGDSVSISGVTQGGNGAVVNNGDGTVTYTPSLVFNGVDSFTYNIVDGNGGNASGTVDVTVIADTDGDGITDTQEGINGTNPLLADSDSDGFFDGHENVVGSNPNSIIDFPATTVISSGNSNNVISVDTTWTLNNSPYWIQTDVSVASGATLTIEPGVVIKSDLNVDIDVNNGGILISQGNAAEPQHIVFTSALDDSINGDTNGDGVATTASDADWSGLDFNLGSNGVIEHAVSRYAGDCIYIANSSPVISNVDIGDCSRYGIDSQTTIGTQTVNLSGINLIDYDANGQASNFSGIRIYAAGAANVVTNISNLNLDEAGGPGSFGLYVNSVSSSATAITGTIDNVTITTPNNDGFNITNGWSGSVDLAVSNVSVSNSGAGNGIDINNASTGTTDVSFDGSNSITGTPVNLSALTVTNSDADFLSTGNWSIDSAGYGLNLINTNGNYNNFTINNVSIAGIRLGSGSDPAEFSNIVLTNAPTPYELIGQDLTPTIIGGYDFSDVSVSKSFIRINSTLLADTTLTIDPLGTGSSVWRVTSNLTVPAGTTLAIDDGAIVKFDSSVLLFVNGDLVIGDGDGLGAKAILTSIRDDSVGDDLGDATAPAAGNWNYISLGNGTNINIDNAIIRYSSYGIYHTGVTPTSFSITNSDLDQISNYALFLQPFGDITYVLNNVTVNNITAQDAIRVANGSLANIITLDFDDITIGNLGSIGNDVNDRGIEIYIASGGSLTGRLDNITISNTFGTALLLQNDMSGVTPLGLVDPIFSGLNLIHTGSRHGLQLIGEGMGMTQPTVDDSFDVGNTTNFIGNSTSGTGGVFGMLIQGVTGTYNNIEINNSTSAALYIDNMSDPNSWDDSTIVISNSVSPWRILTDFPTSIGILGTSDLGYTAGAGLVQSYFEISGTLTDTTLVADPLNTGVSVWHIPGNITIPSGVTLTVEDGAILKFALNTIMDVSGSLIVGDGDGSGADAVFTSIRDDSAGHDSNGDGSATSAIAGDWSYIQTGNGSVIDIDNATIQYADYGIYHLGVTPSSFEITSSNILSSGDYGLYLLPFGDITYTISDLMINNVVRNDGIRIGNSSGTNTITLAFDGIIVDDVGDDVTNDRGIEIYINNGASLTGNIFDLTVSNTVSTAVLIQNDQTGVVPMGTVDPVISGTNITHTGTRYGLQISGEGQGNTAPTIDDSADPGNVTNFIGSSTASSGGVYGLLVQGANGDYSNITINNSSTAAMLLSGNSNPTSWDDATIDILNSASPWFIRTAFPSSIGVLGTADLGYTPGAGLIENYVVTGSTVSDMDIGPDPLNTGNSVWYLNVNMTVPAGETLTISDGSIIKMELNSLITVDGTLTIGDGDGLGSNAIITSVRDDTVGVDLGDPISPTAGDWSYIEADASSIINIDNAIVRYADYGLYQNGVTPQSIDVTNSTFSENFQYGIFLRSAGDITYTLNNVAINNTVQNDAIYINNSSLSTITVDFDDISIDNVGNGNTNDRGIEVSIGSDGMFTGRMDNIIVNDTDGASILIQNTTGGLVDPILSGLNLTNGLYGLQIVGQNDGMTLATVNNDNGTNFIGDATAGSGGSWGLLIQGADGDFSNITIQETTISALYFDNNSNPSTFNSITLLDSPTPYTLIGMSIPTNVGYIAGSGLAEDYLILRGDMIEDLTLTPDPLGTGTSVWYLSEDLIVPFGLTLTVPSNTVVKSTNNADLFIDGTFNVTATVGQEAVFTDFRDDTYNGDSNADGAGSVPGSTNWEGIDFREGSSGAVDNLIVEHAQIGLTVNNAGDGGVITFTNLTINNAVDGLYINQTSPSVPTSPEFNGIAINDATSQSLYLRADNTTEGALMQPVFTGNLTIDIAGTVGTDGVYCNNAGPNFSVSNFTITGGTNGVDMETGCSITFENNIVRDALIGIRLDSDQAPLIRDNVIVNNGSPAVGNYGGIYADSTNAFIFNNLIRQNQGAWGAGIYVETGSTGLVIQNNLIVENEASNATWGGGGILVFANASPSILSNTIANNSSTNNTEGAGLSIEASNGTTTILDNILYGNIGDSDGTPYAFDFNSDNTGTIVENFNLIGDIGTSAYTPIGVNNIVGFDPLFTDGWYLTVDALDGGGADSPAIDMGSDLASNSAVGAGVVILSEKTTRTDGVAENVGSTLDIGYHYPGGSSAPVVSLANSTATPASFLETSNTGGTVVTMTITPRDSGDNIIGAGLIVVASAASFDSNLGSVSDRGDGTYEVTYTIPVGDSDDTVSFTVNGSSAITATTFIDWNL